MTVDVQSSPEPGANAARAALSAGLHNVRMMHCLERLAVRFKRAGVPLMALKGAALNLIAYEHPHERPMTDLDLLVRPEDVDRAFALLEEMGGLRGECLVREDFFPRFHYEMEYTIRGLSPVRIDLHVRPFRPLRYSQTVPEDAFWSRARTVHVGRATVLVPAPEDMIIHLATHAAVHGNARPQWLADIKRWIELRSDEIDWDLLAATAEAWGLALPVCRAMEWAQSALGPICPIDVLQRLRAARTGWRDRLVLWQAPRDAQHPAAHVLVNSLCTPGWRFPLAYLLATLVPGRGHMSEWYCQRHAGWLAVAYLLRLLWPAIRLLPPVWLWFTKIKTGRSPLHGTGVFATRDIAPGEVIARYRRKPIDRHGMYVGYCERRNGGKQCYELSGKLRFLNHCCRPNARLEGFRLVAVRPVLANEEITIDYGIEACACRRQPDAHQDTPPAERTVDAA